MPANTSIQPGTTTIGRLRLFTVYADVPAAVRLKWLIGQIIRRTGKNWELSAEMWKLGSVASDGPLKEMVAQAAAEADLLVIAVSSLDQREPALIQWLESVAAWKANRRHPGLLIGLLGDDEHQAGELDWMVSQLGGFSRRTQMDFIWQWMGYDATRDTGWLFASVETLLAVKSSPGEPEPGVTTPSGEMTGKGFIAVS